MAQESAKNVIVSSIGGMMTKVLITKGLPGSGKSTWAKQYVDEHPGTKRFNRDTLRAMMDNGKWSKANEKFIVWCRNLLIQAAIEQKHDVIIDDCNFGRNEQDIREQLYAGIEVVVQDFTDVPPAVCIERDLKRAESVGDRVIKRMYRQYLQPKLENPTQGRSFPSAIMCDMDGTLALFGDANPYDRDFLQDKVNHPVARMLMHYSQWSQEIKVILLSGRSEKYRDQTEEWLKNNAIKYYRLFMRPDGDSRKDAIVKKELFEKWVLGNYFVTFVLDDRDQCVDLWRSLGLTCLQVADGAF
jgi:predicted kinase